MLAVAARIGVGTIFAPTIDYASGKQVKLIDIIPFGRIGSMDYTPMHFVQDLGYSASGALFAASPYFGQVLGAEVLAGGSVTAGTAALAGGSLAVTGVLAAGVGTMVYIDSLQPGTEEYTTMSALAANLRL